MYTYKNLKNVKFSEIVNCVNSAFSDYLVPVNVTSKDLKERFYGANVNYELSFGAFYNDKLIGLMINGIDTFKGNLSAFDALTGIEPEHRGKGVFTGLFEKTIESFKLNNIKNYYLEVITKNKRAVKTYKKHGFEIIRDFSVLTGKVEDANISEIKVSTIPFSKCNFKVYSNYEPSFENQVNSIKRNSNLYNVSFIERENGYTSVIYNKNGEIKTIKFNPNNKEDLYNILLCISKEFDKITISNIPNGETHLIEFLYSIGFSLLAEQYEMVLKI